MSKPVPIAFATEELPLAEIREPVFLACLRHWEEARGPRRMPARRDVHPESIRAAVGYVGLIDVKRDGPRLDFRYRMFGTLMADALGSDFTNRDIDQVEPAPYAAMVRRSYEETVAAGRPKFHRVRFTHNDRQRVYSRLLLPLADDGETPDRLWATTHAYEQFWVDLNYLLRRPPPGDLWITRG